MSCALSPACSFTEIPLEQISVQWDGPALGKKAQAFPARKTIFIDRAFWRSIPTVVGRAGLLAHERGHIEGARCEPCADRRGGEILRREGWPTARDAQVVALSRLENRSPEKAAEALGQGFGAEGFLENRDRAAGVDDRLLWWLDDLAETGHQFGGKTWRVSVGVDGGRRDRKKQRELYLKGRKLIDAAHPDDPKSYVDVPGEEQVTWTLNSEHLEGKAVDVWVLDDHGRAILELADAKAAGVDLDELYMDLGARGAGAPHYLKHGGLGDKPHFGVFSTSPARPAVATSSGSSSSSSSAEAGDVEASPADAGDGLLVFGAAAAVLIAFAVLAV